MLAGSHASDTSASILGGRSRMPIAVGRRVGIGFGWPFADVGVRARAAAAGIRIRSRPWDVLDRARRARGGAGACGSRPTCFKKREITLQLIERARQLGYDALMVTVDVPVGGKRERDFRNDYVIPFRFSRKNVSISLPGPAGGLAALRHGMPVLENVASFAARGDQHFGDRSSVGRFWDADFNGTA